MSIEETYQGQIDKDNEIVSCPFNQKHKMKRSKLIFHFSKCKTKLLVYQFYDHCPYNYMHIYLKEIIHQHIQQCPDQLLLKKYNVINDRKVLLNNKPEFDWGILDSQQSTQSTYKNSKFLEQTKQPYFVQRIIRCICNVFKRCSNQQSV